MSREAKTKAWFVMRERLQAGVLGMDWGSQGGDRTVFSVRHPDGSMQWKTVSERAAPPFRGSGRMLNFERNDVGVYELP